MNQVLVLGGTGTISLAVVKELVKQGYNVSVVNRGNKSNVLPKEVRVIVGDVNGELDELLNGYQFDVVCDFLTFTPDQAKQRVQQFKNIKQYMFVSTAVVYSRDEHVVLNEDSVKGNHWSEYGLQKQAAEEVFQSSSLPVTIVRPTQTYDNQRLPLSVKGKGIWPVIKRIKEGKEVIVHGDGTSTWVCMHSDDFARAFVALIGREEVINDSIQITGDEVVNWNMIYQWIAEALNVELHPVYIPSSLLQHSKTYDLKTSIYGDKRFSVVFDNHKLKKLLPNFAPTISMKEGIIRYLKEIETNPSLCIDEQDFDAWMERVLSVYHRIETELIEVI